MTPRHLETPAKNGTKTTGPKSKDQGFSKPIALKATIVRNTGIKRWERLNGNLGASTRHVTCLGTFQGILGAEERKNRSSKTSHGGTP